MLCLVCLLCSINVLNHVAACPITGAAHSFQYSKSLFMEVKNIKPDLFEKSLNLLAISGSIKHTQERFSWICDILTRTENIEVLESVSSSFYAFVADLVESIRKDLPYEPKE